MSKPVDVYITQAELDEGRKVKKTACLQIDHSELRPVHCVSKPGISSSTLFSAPEPRRVGRYLSDAEMAVMYDKFVGPSSLNNAAVRHEQAERERMANPSACNSAAPSAFTTESRVPSIDSGDRTAPSPSAHMAVVLAAAGCPVSSAHLKLHDPQAAAEKAAANVSMKYVAPKIAKKYGIQQSFTPAGARAAAAAAASRTSGAYRSGVAHAPNQKERTQGLPDDPSGVDDTTPLGKPPRPPSAAFGAVSRDKAQRTGSHFVYGGNGLVPAPGKYTPKYGATEKARPALAWSKPPSASGVDEQAAAVAAGGGGGGGDNANGGADGGHQRSASASLSSRRPRPSSAPASGPAPANAAHRTAPPQARTGLQRSASSGTRGPYAHGGSGGLTAEARVQLQNRHEELFAAAHRVHPRKEYVPGSQPFKAVERKTLFESPMANNLFGEYYNEGYDRLTRRSSRPSSAFQTQKQRQWANGPLGETGPCVGPGSYGVAQVPATNTGRHVPAGHPGLSKTTDFSRTAPRPASAPSSRPPPASAVQHGYWGPDGPSTSLFPDEPNYNELVSVRFLQERTSTREPSGGGVPPRRPPSHQISLHSQLYQRQTSIQSQGGQAVQGTEAEEPGTGGAGRTTSASGHVDERPVSYVTADRLGALSSAGLAKRVPGGSFSNLTREGSSHAMRAMSANKIIPPAAAGVRTAHDLSYDYDYGAEAHRGRTPSWNLPPNRVALSQQWMQAAATAYMS